VFALSSRAEASLARRRIGPEPFRSGLLNHEGWSKAMRNCSSAKEMARFHRAGAFAEARSYENIKRLSTLCSCIRRILALLAALPLVACGERTTPARDVSADTEADAATDVAEPDLDTRPDSDDSDPPDTTDLDTPVDVPPADIEGDPDGDLTDAPEDDSDADPDGRSDTDAIPDADADPFPARSLGLRTTMSASIGVPGDEIALTASVAWGDPDEEVEYSWRSRAQGNLSSSQTRRSPS
jgi:hypothetical protein